MQLYRLVEATTTNYCQHEVGHEGSPDDHQWLIPAMNEWTCIDGSSVFSAMHCSLSPCRRKYLVTKAHSKVCLSTWWTHWLGGCGIYIFVYPFAHCIRCICTLPVGSHHQRRLLCTVNLYWFQFWCPFSWKYQTHMTVSKFLTSRTLNCMRIYSSSSDRCTQTPPSVSGDLISLPSN